MSRSPGYIITAKLFISAPKDSFKAQAKAATLAAKAVDESALTPELIEASTLLDIKGQFGSADLGEPKPEPATETTKTDNVKG